MSTKAPFQRLILYQTGNIIAAFQIDVRIARTTYDGAATGEQLNKCSKQLLEKSRKLIGHASSLRPHCQEQQQVP